MILDNGIEVLVVDDDRSFLSLTQTYLEREDERLEVDSVCSGYKALDVFGDYDCLVSDYQMPDIDGLELLNRVRNEFNSDIPFIMFTGKGREEVAMDALNLGADRYLQKGGDPKTQFMELAHTITSTTKERFMEKRLELEKKRAEKYFETAQVIMVVIDLEGEVVQANQKACEVLGYSKKELIGLNWIENFIPQYLQEIAREKHLSFLKTGEKDFNIKSPIITRDGEERVISWRNSTIEDEEGKAIASLNAGVDVTDDLSRQRELKEKTWMLEGMLDGITDIVWFQLPNHETIKINKKGLKQIDVSYNEAIGEKCYKILGRQSLCPECPVEKSIQSKSKEVVKKYIPEIDRHLEVVATPILNEENEVEFVVEHLKDLSNIRELAKRHRLIKYSVDQAAIEIYWMNPEGKFIYANNVVRDKLGYSPKELKEMYVWDVDPEFPKKWREKLDIA
ncbi:PAS domain S-box protein [Methanonatronarchaeum sp. AMET-Sl]|uniref:response regulator n=1 Tax=Methanonatronarchaeum sp. AMET-Sl TaxID=3037654 RepID=UPI00244E1C00|nr:PAS domain S-box protein [Methanonatronarchaeum sp. AMET-Sl]WGI18062.1 PAS domain S-box protein [Methanonatronarchaeum sp. AMET-Sl]